MSDSISYEEVIRVPQQGLITDGENVTIPESLEDKIERVLISPQVLQSRIKALARQICEDYKDRDELDFIINLKGAFFFSVELGREIYNNNGPDIKYHFIKTSTYGESVKQEGETERKVKIELFPNDQIGGNVLLIDDILDQGFTLKRVNNYLSEKSIDFKTCILVNKILESPSEKVRQLRDSISVDYVGFEIPDVWIAGYGSDFNESYRNLPFIFSVKS